ncbi:MAG TPA: imidazole glycerol phosphate synthase subunit HisH [Kofleriaceae bacterium]|jgi:glutamine amidotransferase|nr:imidazole glycerol phosphate synthase subunit HisH [Kofleriaceae bacterium]
MIAIVDVCSGNLRSVERALARAGGDVAVTRDAAVVRRADKIVVPGQGAFGMFMRGLVERGLGEPIREAIASGRPFLGICLGMQVLFESSEEQGPCDGLGVIRGRVVRIAPTAPEIKVPHIGWNRVVQHGADPMLAGVADGAHVYFDHSYHAVPADPAIVALDSDHGIPITAAIRKDNIFACQFHPEKSQAVGLQILRNFVERA